MQKICLFLLFISLEVFVTCGISAEAASPLAILKSDGNSAAYADQHLGNFDEAWVAFKHTLESANVRYEVITDSDLIVGVAKLAPYKVIVLPYLLDLPADGVFALSEYIKKGGKLIITDGGGALSPSAKTILESTGVEVKGHSTTQEGRQLMWPRTPLALTQDFAIGTHTADIGLNQGATAVANWLNATQQEISPAIGRLNGNTYLSWALGVEGEVTTNAQIISLALEDASPGITQQAAVQISYADYQNIQQETEYLAKRTDEVIKTAKQADLAVPFKTIQQNYESALAHIKAFQDAYGQRRFYQADEELSSARQDFALAFAQAIPVRPVEARSIWLDRGTIIATKNRQGMASLFDRLKTAGINIVYFETNNAGFCMYPTSVSAQNPELNGWDALGAAVTEAHKRGMELHSWIWVFAVGNLRHNPIVGREPDYPGPVLALKNFSWALARQNGVLLPNNQPEFWIDPANKEGRQFVASLIEEIVTNYAIDGIQLDYIRYPFNGRNTEMGFDWSGRVRFERETGLSLDTLNEETRQVWQAWKITQVNSFVEEISRSVRKIRPRLRISAAVYATPRRLRLNSIQQEWETWVLNGWVDTLNPMSYVLTAKDLTIMASYVCESSENKALVYPGLSIRQLDTAGLIEQLDTSRSVGTLGTTIFATAQLDDKKLNLLKVGPYRKKALLTPQSDPIKASRLLIDDFSALVNRYLQDPQKHILSDQASTNEILTQIEALQKDLHALKTASSAEEIAIVAKQVTDLRNNVKEWLRIEAFVQRGFRAQYIASYLIQIEALLSYASHKAKVQLRPNALANTAG